jgi:cbb3-type cytochrome oxidase cytochrome c subunit
MDQPRSTTPGSVMPRYPHLLKDPIDDALVEAKMRAMRTVGVPYTDGEIATAKAAIAAQAQAIASEVEAQQGPPGLADREITALTAYLQRLGTDIRWRRPEVQPPLALPAAPAAAVPAAAPVAAAR